MSAARSLRLRRCINAIQRQVVTRCYSVEAVKTSHTAEDQTLFLQAQDQAALRDTQAHLDRLASHVQKFAAHIEALPSTVPVLVGVKTVSPKDGSGQRDVEYATTTVPYATGLLRARVKETTQQAQAVVARAEHINEHLLDLQHEPYPSQTGKPSPLAEWHAETSKLSQQEKEDMFKTMQLDEEAEVARLKSGSSSLMQTVRKIEEMARKDTPERAENPFAKAKAKAGPSKAECRSLMRRGGGPGEREAETKAAPEPGATPSPPSPSPMSSLSDLQKRLEESMKTSG